MDATTLVDALTEDLETQLSRLGSSKWLYALTGGELNGSAVRAATAADAAAAADRFDAWADAAAAEPLATAFAALAADAAERREAAGGGATVDAPERLHGALADLDDDVARGGGALGYALVLDRTVGQTVGFFVGDADPTTADRFRSIRSDLADARDDAAAALEAVCETDDDWDRARSAATAVVEAAYDDYVATLESMGVEPKNVC
jgi:hypothetical protein